MEFSPQAREEFQRILDRSETKQGALMMTLHLAQREFGCINPEVEELIASELDLMLAYVRGVVTFYTYFHTEPVGKYLLQFCSTLPCALRGSEALHDHCCKKLGIKSGATTSDGKFTVIKVECLGSCGTAPVVQVNEDYHEDMSVEKLDKLLDSLE